MYPANRNSTLLNPSDTIYNVQSALLPSVLVRVSLYFIILTDQRAYIPKNASYHYLGMGPLIGRWNVFLEKNFPLRMVGGSKSGTVDLKALGKRVLADQSVM